MKEGACPHVTSVQRQTFSAVGRCTQCSGTEQMSQETEWSAFWKGCRESPLTFLQHAQRLIGNGKTAALRAAGPEGEPASEPAPRFPFLLTQGQTPDASALGGPTAAPQVRAA